MDFNIGIILHPNDFGHFINMTEVEDYVQFEAQLTHFSVNENKNRVLNLTNLTMVPCTKESFHEPYDPLRDVLLSATPYAFCIKNHKDIAL